MKRRVIPWATALFFITIFSCEKNKLDPECKDASCCHPEYNGYAGYITDMPAHLSGPPQFSSWGIRIPSQYPPGDKYTTDVFTICDNSLDKIRGFAAEIVPHDSTKIIYRYLVSGKVLADVKNPRLLPTPILEIYIDKITKVK